MIVIGGGITQDIGSFVGACYKRGFDWTYIPTTLLAQCDSCIGSKSGLNYKGSKNQIGMFSPPSEIKINKEIVSFLLKSGLPSSSEQITEEKNVSSNDNLQTSRPENTTNNNSPKEQKPQRVQPVRVEQKAGRNEKVTITNGKETKELKWKKARPLVESGKWTRV